jgi:hypothetical protein
MFELYKSPHYGLGTCVEVHIDKENGLIRRQYKENAVTVSGEVTNKSKQEIQNAFAYELFWLDRLESKWVPKTIDIDMNSRTIVQEYTYPDLLHIKPKLKEVVPDIVEQVIEMYKFFKEKNVYKRNGSLSNLTLRDGQLVAFDFKWARLRPNGVEMELRSYDEWLSKIDSSLPNKLRELL